MMHGLREAIRPREVFSYAVWSFDDGSVVGIDNMSYPSCYQVECPQMEQRSSCWYRLDQPRMNLLYSATKDSNNIDLQLFAKRRVFSND